MKTTQQKVLTAYTALVRIRKTVKGIDALNAFHLKNQLEENVNFQSEEETKLIQQLGGTINEAGVIDVPHDKRLDLNKAMKELREMEVDIKIDIPSLSLERNPEITLEDIEQLNGFVNFR